MNLHEAWAVILAGGDGTRLRSLTRTISGEDRPKQFCPLYGGQTLLTQTRARLAPAISPERTLFSVVQAHERFYEPELAAVEPSRIVVQPSNKGTTAAIIFSLQRVMRLAGNPVVGFFPTDHYYAREAHFVDSVRLAMQIAASRLDTIILLGARAEHPEVEYGWIEPGLRLSCPVTDSLLRVHRFWEKPSTQVAEALLARECLWNTFVMIGRASAFLTAIEAAVPRIAKIMENGHRAPGSRPEPGNHAAQVGDPTQAAHTKTAYDALHPGDFSQQVLSVSTAKLAVLPLGDIGWSDLGTPERVASAMTKYGLRSHRRGPAHEETSEGLTKAMVC